MPQRLLLLGALLALSTSINCAADGDGADSAGAAGSVSVAIEPLSSSSNVNCADNGATLQMKSATPQMAVACGMAMQFQSGYYACHPNDSVTAQCDLAFGSGPTPLVARCDQNTSGERPLRNPPGGYLVGAKLCGLAGITFPTQSAAVWGERRDSNHQPYFPIAKGATYSPSCGQCNDAKATLSYNVSNSSPTVWFNY